MTGHHLPKHEQTDRSLPYYGAHHLTYVVAILFPGHDVAGVTSQLGTTGFENNACKEKKIYICIFTDRF